MPTAPEVSRGKCEAIAILRKEIVRITSEVRRDTAIGVIVSIVALVLAICSAISKTP